MLVFFGIVIYGIIYLLRDISMASILVSAGLFLMFGSPTIYFFSVLIVSFCGRKVVGQVVSSQYFSGGTDNSGHWQVVYVYSDLNGKMKFGTLNCGDKRPIKSVLVRYWGIFNYASMLNDVSQEEYDTYKWSNVEMKEAEFAYKKYRKKDLIFTYSLLVLSIVLIIFGAVLTM